MNKTTDDPKDPGINNPMGEGEQNQAYLVLSDEERAKGFVRPVRQSYKHNTCGTMTTMSISIAETYARNPKFYGSTWCTHCKDHLPVGEFVWDGTFQTVGS